MRFGEINVREMAFGLAFCVLLLNVARRSIGLEKA
jgi:TRAP-type uncharacterized transport system fused permease subunit